MAKNAYGGGRIESVISQASGGTGGPTQEIPDATGTADGRCGSCTGCTKGMAKFGDEKNVSDS